MNPTTFKKVEEFLESDPIYVYRPMLRLFDVKAAVFVSQLLDARRRGSGAADGWLERTRAEWRDACGITAKEFRRIKDELEASGFIEVRQGRYGNQFRANVDRLHAALVESGEEAET